jgi:hypothetical protein
MILTVNSHYFLKQKIKVSWWLSFHPLSFFRTDRKGTEMEFKLKEKRAVGRTDNMADEVRIDDKMDGTNGPRSKGGQRLLTFGSHKAIRYVNSSNIHFYASVFVEKLTVIQLVKKFHVLHVTLGSIIVFTRITHWTLNSIKEYSLTIYFVAIVFNITISFNIILT